MSNKRPLNLTLEPEIIVWLDQIMEKRHYTSRSILVEEMIRERYDQVFPDSAKSSSSKSASSPAAEEHPAAKKKRAA